MNIILIVYLDTTPAYFEPMKDGVLCPSKTQCAFLVKSFFTLDTKWPVTSLNSSDAFLPEGRISKATPKPFLSSIWYTCSMLLGISIPYLWVVFLIFVLIKVIITSLFLKVYGTYHTKAGLLSISLDLAYSINSIRFYSLRSFMGTHDSDLSFHCTSTPHPEVVFMSLLFHCFEIT